MVYYSNDTHLALPVMVGSRIREDDTKRGSCASPASSFREEKEYHWP